MECDFLFNIISYLHKLDLKIKLWMCWVWFAFLFSIISYLHAIDEGILFIDILCIFKNASKFIYVDLASLIHDNCP